MAKTFPQLERQYDGFYAPTFELSVGSGTTLSPAEGWVTRVQVRTALDRANRVSFELGGVYDQASGTFKGLQPAIKAGTSLDVKVGYGSRTELVLAGQITSVRPRFPADGAPTVRVVGHDYRHAMAQATHDESWEKTSVPAVAEKLLANYSKQFKGTQIGPEGPGAGDGAGGLSGLQQKLFEKQFKSAESDFQFLGRLAETFGYELFSREGVFHLRQPPDAPTGGPAVELSYGTSLQSFTPAQPGGTDQVGTFEIRGYDPKSGEPITGTADRQGGGDQKRVKAEPVRSPEEAEQRAKAEARKADRQERSDGETLGLPDLRIGDWVGLTGLGGEGSLGFDGTYYLHEVTHTVGQSGFSTSFSVSRPAGSESQP